MIGFKFERDGSVTWLGDLAGASTPYISNNGEIISMAKNYFPFNRIKLVDTPTIVVDINQKMVEFPLFYIGDCVIDNVYYCYISENIDELKILSNDFNIRPHPAFTIYTKPLITDKIYISANCIQFAGSERVISSFNVDDEIRTSITAFRNRVLNTPTYISNFKTALFDYNAYSMIQMLTIVYMKSCQFDQIYTEDVEVGSVEPSTAETPYFMNTNHNTVFYIRHYYNRGTIVDGLFITRDGGIYKVNDVLDYGDKLDFNVSNVSGCTKIGDNFINEIYDAHIDRFGQYYLPELEGAFTGLSATRKLPATKFVYKAGGREYSNNKYYKCYGKISDNPDSQTRALMMFYGTKPINKLPEPILKKLTANSISIKSNLDTYGDGIVSIEIYKNGEIFNTISINYNEEYILNDLTEGVYYAINVIDRLPKSDKSNEISIGKYFSLNLFINKSEANRLDKTSLLYNVGTLYGVLRNSSSIINPIINLYYEDVPEFNYVYIEKFKRYYYVRDITSVRTNFWEISLEVDVLMSNKNEILQQHGIISRNEFLFNNFIIDDRIYSENDFETTILTSNVGKVSIGGWNEEKQEEITTTIGDDFSYVFCVMTGLQYYSTPVIDGQANIVDNRVPYFVSKEDYGKIIAKILVPDFFETIGNLFDSASNYIISNYIIPFNMYDLNIEQNSDIASPLLDRLYPTNIFCRNIDLGYSGLLIDKGAKAKVTFTFNNGLEINDFTDNTPFSRYFINLPFYGIVEIDSTQVGNLNRIIYDLDVSTGDFICKIGETYEYVGNMYIELPLGSTNAVDIYRNVVETGISLVGSLITSGVSNHFNISNATAMRTPKTNKLSKKGKNALRSAEQNIVQDAANISTGALGDFISSIIPSGSCDSTIGRYISFKRNISQVEIYKIKPKYFYPAGFYTYNGRPLLELKDLNSVHGYTEILQIHLEHFTCTDNEINEIESYLVSGVILP